MENTKTAFEVAEELAIALGRLSGAIAANAAVHPVCLTLSHDKPTDDALASFYRLQRPQPAPTPTPDVTPTPTQEALYRLDAISSSPPSSVLTGFRIISLHNPKGEIIVSTPGGEGITVSEGSGPLANRVLYALAVAIAAQCQALNTPTSSGPKEVGPTLLAGTAS